MCQSKYGFKFIIYMCIKIVICIYINYPIKHMEGLNCDKYKKSSKFWSRANKSSANKGKHVINVTAAFQNQQVYRMPWIVHTVHNLHWPVLECSRRGYLWGLFPPSLFLWSRVELQILAYLLLQSLLFFLLENPIKKWSLNLEVVFFF